MLISYPQLQQGSIQSNPTLTEISFSWEILVDKFWILYLPRISAHLHFVTLYLILLIKFTSPVNVSKIAGWVANSSYDIIVATKEWSIAEKISRLSWDSNPVLLVKIQCSNHWAKELTPWRSCQRLNIYLQAMRSRMKILDGITFFQQK